MLAERAPDRPGLRLSWPGSFADECRAPDQANDPVERFFAEAESVGTATHPRRSPILFAIPAQVRRGERSRSDFVSTSCPAAPMHAWGISRVPIDKISLGNVEKYL